MIDPRLAVIHRRTARIGRILVFSSAKGGVGKSVCAVLSALALAASGHRTGLLDLDFQGASAHLLLGARLSLPEEDSGIKPLRLRDSLDFMSFAAFSGEQAVPLRGRDVTEAMIELLAVTVWGPLDFLLIDMPPGIADELLDIIRLLERPEFVVVSTPSGVVVRVVERLLGMLRELNVSLLGVIENMAIDHRRQGGSVAELAVRYRAPLLGSLPFLPDLERILAGADPLDSDAGPAIRAIVDHITIQP